MTQETFTVISENVRTDNNSHSLASDNKDSLLIIILDRSQLIMTSIGLVANVGTSTTLIKNGQVGMTITGTISKVKR